MLTEAATYDELYRNFRWDIPARFNIATACCDRYADGTGRLALIYIDEDGAATRTSFDEVADMSRRFANVLDADGLVRGDRVAVFLSSNATAIPRTLVRNLKNNHVLHAHTVLLAVTTEPVPRVLRGARLQVSTLSPGLYRVQAHIGFMETANVPRLLRDAERLGLEFRTADAIYFLGRDDIVVGAGRRGMAPWRKRLFVFLANNSQFASAHFGIPPERLMEAGGQVEI